MRNPFKDIPLADGIDLGDLIGIGKTLKSIVTVVEKFRADATNEQMHAAAKAALNNVLDLMGELEDKPIPADIRARIDLLADDLIHLAVQEFNLVREQVAIAQQIQARYAEIQALQALVFPAAIASAPLVDNT